MAGREERRSYLLIDVCNVIHAVPSLRKRLSDGLDNARDALAEAVLPIHDAEGLNVVLVLDSTNDKVQTEYPYGKKTFEYLYAPAALSADGAIERVIARLSDPSSAYAASNDNMVRESIRSLGANALRPEELLDWAAGCRAQIQRDLERKRKQASTAWENRLEF